MKYLKAFINRKPWEMEFSELVSFIEENGLRLTHSSDKKYYYPIKHHAPEYMYFTRKQEKEGKQPWDER